MRPYTRHRRRAAPGRRRPQAAGAGGAGGLLAAGWACLVAYDALADERWVDGWLWRQASTAVLPVVLASTGTSSGGLVGLLQCTE